MKRGSCVDCEEQDAVLFIDDDEVCSTCYTKRLKQKNWIKACKYDNIDPDSKFVVFSDDNPYKNK